MTKEAVKSGEGFQRLRTNKQHQLRVFAVLALTLLVGLVAGCGGAGTPEARETSATSDTSRSNMRNAKGDPKDEQASDKDASSDAVSAGEVTSSLPKDQPSVKPVQMLNGPFDRVKKTEAQGEPSTLSSSGEPTYFLWLDEDDTWQLRMAGNGESVFRGVISPEDDELANFEGSAPGLDDRFRFRSDKLVFAMKPGSDALGFSFDADYAKCVRFRFLIDGNEPAKILLGTKAEPASTNRFKICQK